MEKQNALFQFEGKPSMKEALPLALQHVVAMIAGCITPAIIISVAAGLEPADKVLLIQMSLIMAGIATFIQVLGVGRLGAKLPMIIGVSFAYVPTMIAVAAQYSNMAEYGPKGAIGVILGAQIVGGFVAIVFGLAVKKISFLFPKLVTGTVVFVIGLSLYPIAMRYMGGGGSVSIPGWGAWNNWFVGIVTLISVLYFNNFTKGITKLASVLFGMVVGYILSIPFGMVDFSKIGTSAWVEFASPLHFGINFEASIVAGFVILFLVNSVQAIGDFTATTVGGMDRVPTDKELQGGIVGYGVTNIVGALFGSLPFATFSQNVGIVGVTKVVNKYVFLIAAGFITIAGLIPKFAALLTTIPYAVIGGATISVFASITMTGIKLIARQPFTFRNTTIVGLSVAIGMGFTSVASQANAAGVEWIPQSVYMALGTSPVVLAAVSAVLLNLLLKEKPEDREQE